MVAAMGERSVLSALGSLGLLASPRLGLPWGRYWRPARQRGPEVLLDDDELRISALRGASDVSVVAFTGVAGGLGQIQLEEFRHSLRGSGAPVCNLVFVIDKQRRWYNHGTEAVISGIVNAQLAAFGTARTVTLGNSMGGFGAIVFAPRLTGCGTAIAFCPQSSVHPAIAPFETRWPEWTGRITQWELPDAVATLRPEIRYHLFFGTQNMQDDRHAARFLAAGALGMNITRIPGCAHDVAPYLKRTRRLRPLLRELILDG